MSVDICTKEEKRQIADELAGFKFSSPYGKEVQKFISTAWVFITRASP